MCNDRFFYALRNGFTSASEPGEDLDFKCTILREEVTFQGVAGGLVLLATKRERGKTLIAWYPADLSRRLVSTS